jgi:hypothetical protein
MAELPPPPGQTTDPEGDWTPAHWPSSPPSGTSE